MLQLIIAEEYIIPGIWKWCQGCEEFLGEIQQQARQPPCILPGRITPEIAGQPEDPT